MDEAGAAVDRRPGPVLPGPVLPSTAVVTGFEIAVLLRCARAGSGRYGRGATTATAVAARGGGPGVARAAVYPVPVGAAAHTGSTVSTESTVSTGSAVSTTLAVPITLAGSTVEFSRATAADRLVDLLAAFDVPARRDEFAAGGWHRYTVHRVVCPGLSAAPVERAWCAGYHRLCDPNPYRPARQRRHRHDLAAAAWRAAVLAGGLRGRGGPLAVRVGEADLALVLVRAARVLGAPVSLRTVGGRHLVEVNSSGAELTLREVAGATMAG